MRPAWLEIDLNAFRGNVRALAAHTGRPVLAVVKANAYGHGLEPVAAAALEAGCPAVGVALVEEGIRLREAGFVGRIVLLALTPARQAEEIARHGLEPVVTQIAVLEALSQAAGKQNRSVGVHVKIDTGMQRIGIPPESAKAFVARLEALPGLHWSGLVTHFATAEAADHSGVEAQWRRFAPLVEWARARPQPPVIHAANSAAGIWFPPCRQDWVRGGLILYGASMSPRPLPLRVHPVMSLHAQVAEVREVPAGAAVGYGGAWTASRPSLLAVLPVGYGDGYPWRLGNRAEVLLNGRRAPIRGRICMDQLLVDVTDVPRIAAGRSVATLLGAQGEEEIRVGELAERADTIPYEIFTRMGERLPRICRRAEDEAAAPLPVGGGRESGRIE